MPTLSCPEAPPCTPVLLTVCRRKSPLLLHPPSRRCGSPSRNMMSAAHPLSTASASKKFARANGHHPECVENKQIIALKAIFLLSVGKIIVYKPFLTFAFH